MIEGIADGKVAFDLDGSKLSAPIDRLEGVVFGGTDSAADSAKIQVRDVYQSEWFAMALEFGGAGKPLTLWLADSVSIWLPLEHIESIRWSGGVIMLAAETPVTNSIHCWCDQCRYEVD